MLPVSKNFTYAVFGVSLKKEKYGNRVFRHLLSKRFKVFGINPKGGSVAGEKLYRSFSELPEVPDVAVIVLSPEISFSVVRELVHLGVRMFWLQPGSYDKRVLGLLSGIPHEAGKCIVSDGLGDRLIL